MIEMNSLRESVFPSGRSTRARFGSRWLAAIATLAACTPAAGLGNLAGQWSLDSTRSDRIERAIETCIEGYPEDAKALSRDRLRETNVLVRNLFVTAKGGGSDVLIGYEQAGNGTIAPLDGTEVPATGATGEEMQLTVAWQGEALVERFQAYNGTRTNTYTVSSDGGTLSVDVQVKSPEMPTVLTYKLAYARKTSSTTLRRKARPIQSGMSERYRLDGRYEVGRSGWRWFAVKGAR